MLLFSNKAQISISIIEAELSTLSGGVPRRFFYNPTFTRFHLPKTVQKKFHSQLQAKQTYSLTCTALQTRKSSPTKTTSPFFKNSKTAGCGYISPRLHQLSLLPFQPLHNFRLLPCLNLPVGHKLIQLFAHCLTITRQIIIQQILHHYVQVQRKLLIHPFLILLHILFIFLFHIPFQRFL